MKEQNQVQFLNSWKLRIKQEIYINNILHNNLKLNQ